MNERARIALVTGASSGIGAATVRALAAEGLETVAAARRIERCEELAAEVGGRALRLDLADPDSVAALAAALPEVDLIIHSAGGALGLEPVAQADEDRWREMWESNVAGVMRVTKALLPALRRGREPHVVILGSVAGVEVYEGGGATPPPSTPSMRSRRPCASSCWPTRSGSPRSLPGWSRPSSRWFASRATPSAPRMYTGASSRCGPRTSPS